MGGRGEVERWEGDMSLLVIWLVVIMVDEFGRDSMEFWLGFE